MGNSMDKIDATENGKTNKPRHRATIEDVAKASGVSTGTVSRVANGRAGVHDATRLRVLNVMRELGYLPDLAARELSFGKNATIGLNVGIGSPRLIPFFVLLLENLNSVIQEKGLRFQEIPTGRNGLPEWTSDGMILIGAHDDDPRIPFLMDRDVPFVLLGRAEGVRWVMSDDYDGGLQATRHLVRLGHKNIVHLSGVMNNQAYHDRYRGYAAALQEAGIEPRRDFILDGEFSTLGGYRAVRKAIESGMKFTAIAAMSDEMAVGAIAAVQDMGLQVPADVSVVGFDDLPEIGEDLTTIHQDIGKISSTAVELLRESFIKEPVRHEVLPVYLIARRTTARSRE